MKKNRLAACLVAISILFALLMSSCAPQAVETRTFAEAHDAFTTKLVKQLNDQDEIPEPPEGVFDLVHFDIKLGQLAAYASSDPGDGQKHPMIIWIVGGWGYGIDEFAWSYPAWDNDQTGSAFREAGVLMMYPSFRGANGNPGYYETVFGEIDDIAAAYEFAASLPYVDPDRIYLGGHSTGGTKALLVSEYTDKFRAVFSFGPVDEIKNHNTDEFTFDTSNQEEYKLRSPIHWLKDIKTPTFVIEGEGGNAGNVRKIEKSTSNENVHCYVVDGEDHFTILAPITRLLAQKILEDTGAESNIVLTDSELQAAINTPPVESMPIMQTIRASGLSLLVPVLWDMEEEDDGSLSFSSPYYDENFWDASSLYVEMYTLDEELTLDQFVQELNGDDNEYQAQTIEVNGLSAHVGEGILTDSEGSAYFNRTAAVQDGERLVLFWFYTPEEYKGAADDMFQEMIGSIELE